MLIILNLISRTGGALLYLGRTVFVILTCNRASAGIIDRNSRAAFECFMNGLNLVVTSVRYLVIMTLTEVDLQN